MIIPNVILLLVTSQLKSADSYSDDLKEHGDKVNASNGKKVDLGKHSHLALFIKKPDADEKLEDMYKDEPTDFSTEKFLCSGTILNRRWVLTKIKPIAFYPIGSYFMSAQNEIDLPVQESELINVFEIDEVAINPRYKESDNTTDLAMARTAKPMEVSFELGIVNLGDFGHTASFNNCKLITWALYPTINEDSNAVSLFRAEMPFLIKKDDSGDNQMLYNLSQLPNNKYEPCAVHGGSPFMCDFVLMGIYVGDNGVVTCTNSSDKNQHVFRLDADPTKSWIKEMTSAEAYDPDGMQDEIYKTCGG